MRQNKVSREYKIKGKITVRCILPTPGGGGAVLWQSGLSARPIFLFAVLVSAAFAFGQLCRTVGAVQREPETFVQQLTRLRSNTTHRKCVWALATYESRPMKNRETSSSARPFLPLWCYIQVRFRVLHYVSVGTGKWLYLQNMCSCSTDLQWHWYIHCHLCAAEK
jgi:hypothetical protein